MSSTEEQDTVMRSVNLIKVAVEAEIVRYKAMAARQARRAGFGLLAFIFVMGFLISLEIAAWQAIHMYLEAIYATLCMVAANLVIAIALAVPALRSSPGGVEIDAVEVRKSALKSLQTSLAISTAVPLAGSLWRRRRAARNPVAKRKLLR
jgi:hypothetical protein